MVRFSTSLGNGRRSAGGGSSGAARKMLRKLLGENAMLLRQLTELRELKRLAQEDTLTGLANRRLLERRFREELARSVRDPRRRGSLLVIDVNDLKQVNDRLGHTVGDEVLREVAETLRASLRPLDVCCRAGGDEFMILLPDTDARGARAVMAKMRAEMIRTGSRGPVPISISIGRATWPEDGRKADDLVEKADRAMYLEKRRTERRARRPAGRGSGKTAVKLTLVK